MRTKLISVAGSYVATDFKAEILARDSVLSLLVVVNLK
jgi:hypothetical protein